MGAGFAPWLKDSSKMYKNYLSNTGAEQWVDYERAYKEDKTMKSTAKWLYDNKWGNSFIITGNLQAIPNGTSENWQKTIGAHYVFGTGGIEINTGTGKATMTVIFYMEDMYDFNPGQADIALAHPMQ